MKIKNSALIIAFFAFVHLYAQNNYVFFGSFNRDKLTSSIYIYELDTVSGKLSEVTTEKNLVNPSYLTLSPNGKYLYACTEGSINPQRQEQSHIHAAVFSPNSESVFLIDLGADKIRSYSFDDTKNQPLQASEMPLVKTALGGGPRHFVFHPNKKFAYCIEELSGTIDTYDYQNKVLSQIQNIATHDKKMKEGYESSDIHISPDGLFLYASNRGKENSIAIFSIGMGGILKNIGYQATFGKHPRTFAIDETGNFLIVTNTISGNVTVFKRNKATGKLKKVSSNLKIKNVSCVKTKRYS